MGFLLWIVSILAICSHSLNSNLTPDDLAESAYTLITTHFSDGCICFYLDFHERSVGVSKLLTAIGKRATVTVVAPTNDIGTNEFGNGRPLKPYPCLYIVDVTSVDSNITWYLMRGKYFQGDYRIKRSHYLFIASQQHTNEQLEKLLTDGFTYGFLYTFFLNPEKSQVNVYSPFPFGVARKSCPEKSIRVQKVSSWKNGEWKHDATMFSNKLPEKMFMGCTWHVSCAGFVPYVLFTGDGIFRGSLQGYDAGVLSLAFERFNLTPVWRIHKNYSWFTILEDGKIEGSIPDLVFGRGAQMSCGGLSTPWLTLTFTDVTSFHSWAAENWYVAEPDKVSKWKLLYTAFPVRIWFYVMATTILMPSTYWLIARSLLSNTETSLSYTFLFLIALVFSNSTRPPPIEWPLRIIFFTWLYYVYHIDQIYTASLTGLITSASYEPSIKTLNQLIERKLPTLVYEYTLLGLRFNPRPEIQELIKKVQLIPNNNFGKALVNMTKYKNFSVMDNKLFVKYSVNYFSNVSVYPVQININERLMNTLMWRHHYLFDRMNRLLLNMFDAGFLVYFLRKTVPDKFWRTTNDFTAKGLTLDDLTGPFYVLIAGLIVSLIIFLGELAYVSFQNSNRLH